jgi:hypothetical protein
MARVTLMDLFNDLEGRHFASRQELEGAVLEIFNRHVTELPIGYSYKDAIEGARSNGWLDADNGQGVTVRLGDARPVLAR